MTQIDPQQERAEKLQELGSILQRTRTERGIAVETIAAKTQIRAGLLRAIEEGNMEELPEPVYIQILLKKYAEALDLDGAEFASAFSIRSNSKKERSSSQWRLPSWSLPFQLRPFHLYLFYILALVLSIRSLAHLVETSTWESNNNIEIEEPDSGESSLVKDDPSSEATHSVSVTNEKKNEQIAVEIAVVERCWLRVVVDGKTVFEDVVPQGTNHKWVANEQLTLRAGNAGGVLVTFNNEEKAKKLGKPGEVEEVTYRVDSR